MTRYVTTIEPGARLAHIGPPALCGTVLYGRVRATDDMPADRTLCPECARYAVRGGVLTRDEAAAFVAQRPVPYADAILNLLADGLPDIAIARRLNIGLRTLTRTVARMMGEAGALSRYQFGYLTALGDVRG